jgi:hypothetical protein
MIVFRIPDSARDYKCPEYARDVTLGKYVSFLKNIAPMEPKEVQRVQELNFAINERIDDLTKWIKKIRQQSDDLSVPQMLDALQRYLDGGPTIKAQQYLPPLIAEVSKLQDEQMALVDSMTPVWYAKNMIPYMARTIEHFTGVHYNQIMGIEGIGMQRKAVEYLFSKISNACNPKETSEYKRSYLVDGEVYELPDKHMENSTLIEFAEAAQFQENAGRLATGQAEALIDVISVILRKPSEQYSEAVYHRNRKTFETLTLADAMEIAFFLMKQSDSYVINFATSTTVALAEEAKAQQDWLNRMDGTSRSKQLRKVVYSLGRTRRR